NEDGRLVLDVCVGLMLGDGVVELDVPNATGRLTHDGGHAIVALAADPNRPRNRLPNAGGRATEGSHPGRARLSEEVREDSSRARAVRTVGDGDGGTRKGDPWVQGFDRRVIPRGDAARKDLAQSVAVKLETARDAGA